MIEPEDIRRKAANLFPVFLGAWVTGEEFFPRSIPCDKKVDENLATAIESIHRLKAESKELRGFGYSIEWTERKSRTHGRNLFPSRIVFDTEQDFLRYIGKQTEFNRFASAVEAVRARYPELEPWMRSHKKMLIESAEQLDGLLQVADYFRANPRPGLFARELPLTVDTKFIERNCRILGDWLDVILPPSMIRADEDHFQRRHGLRYAEPHIMVRFLDKEVQRVIGSPWAECSVPLHALAKSPMSATRAIIVENKVNLLTLPETKGAIGLGGLGNSVTDLRYVSWLADTELWYWGDIDAEGFHILSRLRSIFPHVRSLFMDEGTLQAWRKKLGAPGSGCRMEPPSNLTMVEHSAYLICASENLRIEQERVPQAWVAERLHATFFEFDARDERSD